MRIKAIFFDHDGTLVDSEMAHYEMWKDVLSEYKIELSYEEYRNNYSGIPTSTNAKLIAENHSLAINPDKLALAKSKATNFYLSQQAFPLMEGAFESISHFFELGLKIGIVTGASKEGVSATIKHYEFQNHISVIVSGDDVRNSKPAPDCYLLAAKMLDLHPTECLAIEDTNHGVEAATTANMACVGVSSSCLVRSNFLKTTHICSSLNEATKWITKNHQLQAAWRTKRVLPC